MAYTTGSITTRSRIYNMTGVANYTASNGVDLGRVSDLVMAKFERDISTYRGLKAGTTPTEAAIDGENCIMRFALWEYDAASMALFTQRTFRTGATTNWHGFAGQNYKLGKILGSSELLSLMIADEDAPNDYPKLYIHRAVVTDVSDFVFSRGTDGSIVSPAGIVVMGLYSSKLGAPFVFGDSASFPSLA